MLNNLLQFCPNKIRLEFSHHREEFEVYSLFSPLFYQELFSLVKKVWLDRLSKIIPSIIIELYRLTFIRFLFFYERNLRNIIKMLFEI